MGFRVLTADNQAISMEELDIQACEFWGLVPSLKYYATPSSKVSNWFDLIGHEIHSPSVNWTSGWKNVKCGLLSMLNVDLAEYPVEAQVERLKSNNEFLKPYFGLIDHWESKGYKPERVKD